MEIMTSEKLVRICEEHSVDFPELLPELIKQLINKSRAKIEHLRIPSFQDTWAPGYDGVVECTEATPYIPSGISVWECGTSKHTLDKLNHDYNKRTDDSLGINKQDTTFCFVLPKIWAFDNKDWPKTQWENSKNEWKKVRVYDAPELVDWINSEPAVCAWLLEKISENKNIEFSTVSTAWDSFSKRTAPPLAETLFLTGRDNSIDKFFKSFSNTFINVQSSSFDDARGFVLAALRGDKEYCESVIVCDTIEAYSKLDKELTDKILFLNFKYDGELRVNNNKVIVCYNKESQGIKNTIVLDTISKSKFLIALNDMGVDSGAANEIYAFTRGNINALIRRIPGNVQLKPHEWCKGANAELIIPLLFLKNINFETDDSLLALLSNAPIETIRKQYDEWLRLDDSPVKKVRENQYTILDYEDVFSSMELEPDGQPFKLLHKAIITILNSLKDDGEWKNYQRRHLSNAIVRMCSNYIYYSYESSSNESFLSAIKELLPFVYEKGTSNEVLESLSCLAEAAPDLVMQFLDDGWRREDRFIQELFDDTGYNARYVPVLSAIDVLTHYEDTSIRACKLLFEITKNGNIYKLGNNPEESLISALSFYNNYGEMLLSTKKELFLSFIKKEPSQGVRLFVKAISENIFFYVRRIGSKKISREQLTYKEVFEAIEEVGSICFKYVLSNKEPDLLRSLLKCYQKFSPDFLISVSCDFTKDGFLQQDLIRLNYDIRKMIFYNASGEESLYDNALKRWFDLTLQHGIVESSAWMFNEYWQFPDIGCCPETIDIEKWNERRIDSLKQIRAIMGEEGLLNIISLMKDDYSWGSILAHVVDASLIQIISKALLDNKKELLFSSLLSSVDKSLAGQMYNMLSESEQLKLLPRINRLDIIEWLDSEEKKQAFWSGKMMVTYQEETYYGLLQYNPSGLLHYCYDLSHSKENCDIDSVIEVLASFIEKNKNDSNGLDAGLISEIVKNVDRFYYTEEWAELCLNLFYNKLTQRLSEGICRYLFENPKRLLELMEDHSMSLSIRLYYRLPVIAYNDYSAFRMFFEELISNDYVSLAGEIIGASTISKDGEGVNEFVSQYLEESNNRELENGVIVGCFNKIEFRTITDGENEVSLGNQFLNQAKQYEISFPHTAHVLKKIGNCWIREGDRDRVISELFG